MNDFKTVLAIGAHPDDLEIICGGTLALFTKNGNKVFMYHATDGDKGGINKTNQTIRAERKNEAKLSAEVIGAESFGGDFHDTEITVTLENRYKMVDIIRKCDPNIIITHHPQDYHTDHTNLSKLVFEASYIAGVPGLKTNYSPAKNFPNIFYMDTICGIGFEPKEYVDISSVMDLKISMLKKHESQLKFVKELSNIDFIDMVSVCAKFRGYQCGAEFAEGFSECFVWPRSSTKRLLP